MKDLLLIIATVTAAAVMFFAVGRLDGFLTRNKRLISEKTPANSVTIAAENPIMLAVLAPALEKLSKNSKDAEFYLKTDCHENIINALDRHDIDMALVFSAGGIEPKYGSIHAKYKLSPIMYDSLPVSLIKDSGSLIIIWDKNHISKNCGMVIEYLQNSLI
ncbi:MAG: hypothetical protein PUF72_07965 [Clostridiales bacterium]|nr:hypothetical protein [Clostridiales bacterium]